MRSFSAAERRTRLGQRHALSPSYRVDDPVAAARAVVALHGTDPATTFLAALARMADGSIVDIEKALYDDRSLIRVLAMRRTVFAVPVDLVAACLAGAADTVAREQRRLLEKMLAEAEVTEDPAGWLREVERVAVEAVAEAGEITSTELAKLDERLATRFVLAPGTKYETTQAVASRILTLMSAEGELVRVRPRGTWTSTQFRWSTLETWQPNAVAPLSAGDAAAELARRWLASYGPATEDDLAWWAGWTKTRTRAALARCNVVEVDLDGQVGYILPGDDEPPAADVDPWVALLPALDPTIMGWKHRDFHLGPHRSLLFDVNGNAGPTVWSDGQVVGGWAQLDSGEVVVNLLTDIGSEATHAVDVVAESLTSMLGDVRLKARARGWTPSEKQLRA
ncbi:winged helix DNA-binding domain-containing protein [Aeromicrobium panaciterrae]|uniref:winged helix DNA-binding domain-containing protein n=1 Tax=Aeromicrobium panaciterrae TaxID=363861 RepID=UPI0031E21C59